MEAQGKGSALLTVIVVRVLAVCNVLVSDRVDLRSAGNSAQHTSSNSAHQLTQKHHGWHIDLGSRGQCQTTLPAHLSFKQKNVSGGGKVDEQGCCKRLVC